MCLYFKYGFYWFFKLIFAPEIEQSTIFSSRISQGIAVELPAILFKDVFTKDCIHCMKDGTYTVLFSYAQLILNDSKFKIKHTVEQFPEKNTLHKIVCGWCMVSF